jgi:hypothetical protein
METLTRIGPLVLLTTEAGFKLPSRAQASPMATAQQHAVRSSEAEPLTAEVVDRFSLRLITGSVMTVTTNTSLRSGMTVRDSSPKPLAVGQTST